MCFADRVSQSHGERDNSLAYFTQDQATTAISVSIATGKAYSQPYNTPTFQKIDVNAKETWLHKR